MSLSLPCEAGEAYSHRNGKPTFATYKEQDGKFFVAVEHLTFKQFKAEFPNAEYYYHN